MNKLYYYETKLGKIGIVEEDNSITHILFKDDKLDNYEVEETSLIKETYKQISEYLDGKRKEFNIPINPKGTEFQRKVWNALISIPYGETRSYKDIALMVGNDKASRAVGMSNNKNPIPFIIPCHRVVGSNGKLVGYRGGLTVKNHLLELEKGSN